MVVGDKVRVLENVALGGFSGFVGIVLEERGEIFRVEYEEEGLRFMIDLKEEHLALAN